MARPLQHVLNEIIRVAEEIGINPHEMRRAEFLAEADVTLHDCLTYGGFLKLRANAAYKANSDNPKDLLAARGVELQNAASRKKERDDATRRYLSDNLLEGMEKLFRDNPISLPRRNYHTSPEEPTSRMITLLWSDLHFGLDVSPREVYGSEFNWNIAARRMAKCCVEAVDWKPKRRKDTTLQVVLNGDILAGVIHLSESNTKEIQEQIWGATAILTHALSFLRQYFPEVRVLCLPGNHDRMTYRSHERAVSQRWNSHAHSIFLGIKIWFKDDPGVTVDVPMTGMGTYKTPGGHLVFATHGDTEPTTSNVGKSFNTDRTIKSLLKMEHGGALDKKVDVCLFGHWHQPSLFLLPDGTTCIVNGCLIGSDSFAQNGAGYFNTMPAQVMFESDSERAIGDFRVVKLRDADNDESLDEVINIPALSEGGLIDFV